MFPGWTCLVGLWFGAAIGSFLNVVIYRMPRGLALSKPKNSFCPSCKNRLAVVDLIPLFSWLFLRGRCRQCGASISSRYFFVELATGTIWAGIWWQYLVAGSDWGKAIAYALAAAALVAVIFIDWEFYIIPDQVNAFLLFVGLAYNGYLYYVHDMAASTHGIPSSVAGALLGVAVLGFITLAGRIAFRKDAMGHGDIKMARGIGAVLFPVMAVISFGLAIALGAVLGILQVVVRMAIDKRAVASGGECDEGSADDIDRSEDLPYEPETISSIVKCVFGYLICLDVVGLFYPKLYIRWFGEDPFEPVVNQDGEQDDWEVERTMIPFGPYLALGAIVATVFEVQLRAGFDAYWKWAAGGPASLEHVLR
jgi:leader peptidase (prepilin peptidase)/N-methyltransferase